MRSLQLFLAMSLIAVFALPVAQADEETASPVATALKNSKWSGTFEAIGASGGITIQFLPKLGAGGVLQYIHTVKGGGELGTVLGPFDKACEFTPRTLKITGINLHNGYKGTIQKYKCAETQKEQDDREKNGLGPADKVIPVDQIDLSEDGTSLKIVAQILGKDVTYTLKRVDVPSTATSPAKPVVPAATKRATR